MANVSLACLDPSSITGSTDVESLSTENLSGLAAAAAQETFIDEFARRSGRMPGLPGYAER